MHSILLYVVKVHKDPNYLIICGKYQWLKFKTFTNLKKIEATISYNTTHTINMTISYINGITYNNIQYNTRIKIHNLYQTKNNKPYGVNFEIYNNGLQIFTYDNYTNGKRLYINCYLNHRFNIIMNVIITNGKTTTHCGTINVSQYNEYTNILLSQPSEFEREFYREFNDELTKIKHLNRLTLID